MQGTVLVAHAFCDLRACGERPEFCAMVVPLGSEQQIAKGDARRGMNRATPDEAAEEVSRFAAQKLQTRPGCRNADCTLDSMLFAEEKECEQALEAAMIWCCTGDLHSLAVVAAQLLGRCFHASACRTKSGQLLASVAADSVKHKKPAEAGILCWHT